MQKHLKVSISGKQFVIATDENENDVYAAVQMVDGMIKDTISKVPVGNEDKVLTLIALHLATDLTKSQRLLETSEQRIEQLVGLCDSEVA